MVMSSVSTGGVVRSHVEGDKQEIIEALTFSGTYKTGGEISIAENIEGLLKQFGQGIIQWVQVTGVPGYLFIFNYATSKLQVIDTGASSGAAFSELAEGEYPAAIREGKPRIFAIGV